MRYTPAILQCTRREGPAQELAWVRQDALALTQEFCCRALPPLHSTAATGSQRDYGSPAAGPPSRKSSGFPPRARDRESFRLGDCPGAVEAESMLCQRAIASHPPHPRPVPEPPALASGPTWRPRTPFPRHARAGRLILPGSLTRIMHEGCRTPHEVFARAFRGVLGTGSRSEGDDIAP